jgi:Predicted protease with the C-terminal PDZ domain
LKLSVLTSVAGAALIISSAAGAQAKRVEYEISFPNAAEHEARVVATFYGVPRGSTLHARMSRSSPGRYATTSFAKSVYDVSAADGHGKSLSVKRADDHEWDVGGHDGTVRIGYTVWGDRIDGTNLSIDHSHAHMNMPATFMWAPETENAPIRLSIHAPRGWNVATQLVPTRDSTTFTAPNLQWFMDSPTEVGPVTWRTWTATYGGKTSTFRIAAHTLSTAAQVDTFTSMARAVVAEEIAMWGEPAGYDFGTYTFIGDYIPWSGGDGMEHRNSTILTSSRGLDTHANRMGNLSSLAHEFFHSWNMERLRSKEIEPFNFDHADMSDGLWFGEGFTNYYGPLLIRRAGYYGDSDYVRRLGSEMVGTINSAARRHGSPVDMSRQAVFFDGGSYPEGTNAPNIFLSYYTWGSMVAAGLDLTLRERFNSSLDDFMRAMWRDFGSHQSKALAPERPYTVADIRAELGKFTKDPAFANDFFRRYVQGREVPDFATLVKPAGLVLIQDSVTKPLLGASLDNDAKGVFVNWTSETGSAYAAGLSSGDIIVSVNGEPATSIDVLNGIIAKHHVGEVLSLNVLQKGKIEAPVSMTLKGIPTLHLVMFESAGIPVTDAVRAFRKSWLGSKVIP